MTPPAVTSASTEDAAPLPAPSSAVPDPAKVELLRYYRDEIKHEFSLLSNRVSAYISSQSFLIIAFASAMGNLNPHWGTLFRLLFPGALAVLGIVLSVQGWLGIRAACDTIILWHVKQNALFEHDPAMDAYHVARPPSRRPGQHIVDRTHEQSMLFALGAPWTFGLAWIIFEALSLVLHLKGP